jgi:hypothetical protein
MRCKVAVIGLRHKIVDGRLRWNIAVISLRVKIIIDIRMR